MGEWGGDGGGEAIAGEKLSLHFKPVWNDRIDTGEPAAAAPDRVILERGAATEQAANAISFVMAPAVRVVCNLGYDVRRYVGRVGRQRVQVKPAGVAEGCRHERRSQSSDDS